MTNPFWNRKTFCLITGASQGIGRQIAIDFAKNVQSDSTFLLLARNIDNLNETKRLLELENPSVNVFVHTYDFNKPIGVELHKLIDICFVTFKQDIDSFELSMIIHNAGSLGDITESVADMKNLDKLEAYFTLNVHSVILLNAEFIKMFKNFEKELCFVNVTSLCAVKAFASMGYYCIGKAARQMYFAVLAEENEKFTVLNYSPGPVDTDMTVEIVDKIQNTTMKKMFVDMKQDGSILTTKQTVSKLINVLRDRKFVNGSRVDYYDEK